MISVSLVTLARASLRFQSTTSIFLNRDRGGVNGFLPVKRDQNTTDVVTPDEEQWRLFPLYPHTRVAAVIYTSAKSNCNWQPRCCFDPFILREKSNKIFAGKLSQLVVCQRVRQKTVNLPPHYQCPTSQATAGRIGAGLWHLRHLCSILIGGTFPMCQLAGYYQCPTSQASVGRFGVGL